MLCVTLSSTNYATIRPFNVSPLTTSIDATVQVSRPLLLSNGTRLGPL